MTLVQIQIEKNVNNFYGSKTQQKIKVFGNKSKFHCFYFVEGVNLGGFLIVTCIPDNFLCLTFAFRGVLTANSGIVEILDVFAWFLFFIILTSSN